MSDAVVETTAKMQPPAVESTTSKQGQAPQLTRRLGTEDIFEQGERALDKANDLKQTMLSPTVNKEPPVFTSSQVAAMCGIDRTTLTYRANSREDLPNGSVKGNGSRREFSLVEARQWINAHQIAPERPVGTKAATIAISMFKGGSTKTTTAMALGQGLTLRGYRVLLVDTDPQNSLTSLCGYLAEAEFTPEDCLAPLFQGSETDVMYAIQPTYWDGLDIIPAHSALSGAEFFLPARQSAEGAADFNFYEVLDQGLEPARDLYDVIIIDTPPSLSYTTVNAMYAADGLIIPVCPAALDYLSAAQFWAMFAELAKGLESRGWDKQYSFVNVLLSKVNTNSTAASLIRQWLTDTYSARVLPVVIPESQALSLAAAKFGTIYDTAKYEGSKKTYQRIREPYDQFVQLIVHSLAAHWSNEQILAQRGN